MNRRPPPPSPFAVAKRWAPAVITLLLVGYFARLAIAASVAAKVVQCLPLQPPMPPHATEAQLHAHGEALIDCTWERMNFLERLFADREEMKAKIQVKQSPRKPSP